MTSPLISSLNPSNPGASKIVLWRVPLLTVSTRTVSRLLSLIWMLYLYLYSCCNLLYRYDVFSFSLVVSICSAFVKPLQVDVQSVNIVSTEIRKQFIEKKRIVQ